MPTMVIPIVMALSLIGVRAPVVIICDLRTSNDRADNSANNRARWSRNDRTGPCSNYRTRDGVVARYNTLFCARERRNTDHRGNSRDSDNGLPHDYPLSDAAFGIGILSRSKFARSWRKRNLRTSAVDMLSGRAGK